MFRWWHKVRDGTMARDAFRKKMRPLVTTVGAVLSTAQACRNRRVAGMAKKILKLEPALWTFVEEEGVEPTNNFAERSIRHAVLWRKASFGTDSTDGSRFVERMSAPKNAARYAGPRGDGLHRAASSPELSGGLVPQRATARRQVSIGAEIPAPATPPTLRPLGDAARRGASPTSLSDATASGCRRPRSANSVNGYAWRACSRT